MTPRKWGLFCLMAMRQLFGQLVQTTQDYITDDSTSSKTSLSDTQTFIKKELNKANTLVFSKLPNHLTQRTQTASTVADQQFYHLPPDFGTLEAATLTVGGINYPLQVVQSYENWNVMNQVSSSGSTLPQFIFPRRDDFGIYPIPSAVNTITFTYNLSQKELTADDYSDSTISLTNGDATVTGSGTVFTAGIGVVSRPEKVEH